MTQETWMDLHVHTRCSDGLLSPSQVVTEAKRLGLSAVGIADHDAISGIAEAVETGIRLGVEVVPGLELSSQLHNRDLHILGYFFDSTNPRLCKHLALFREERQHRAERMVHKLNEIGVNIRIDEVEAKSKGCSIGRPHIAEVLMDKGYVETFQDAFRHYIGYGGNAYVEKYKISPEEAIALIADAHGLSFLAHPGPIVSDAILLELIKSGLDGLEVVHPNLTAERTQELQEIARMHNLLISGGSDCHGGREGNLQMGRYKVPYALLDMMKAARAARWGDDSLNNIEVTPFAARSHSGH